MDAINIVNLNPNIRLFRDRLNPIEFYSDAEFQTRYRLRKDSFLLLCDIISPSIENDADKNYSLYNLFKYSLLVCHFLHQEHFWYSS